MFRKTLTLTKKFNKRNTLVTLNNTRQSLSLTHCNRRLITTDELKAAQEKQVQEDLERFGVAEDVDPYIKYKDEWSKHRRDVPLWSVSNRLKPLITDEAFAAPCATLIGNVELWPQSSVWYGCTLKADVNLIQIGALTNIQDKTVITEAIGPLDADHDGSTVIGHYVTVGHKCVLRACTIENQCLVGIGSVLEEGSYMETKSQLGAGSVLAANTRIPSGQLWMGNPAKYVRDLTPEEQENIMISAQRYVDVANQHKEAILGSGPYQTAHWQLEKAGHKVGAQEWPAVPPRIGEV